MITKILLVFSLLFSINSIFCQSDTVFINRLNDSTVLLVKRTTNADLTYSETASLLKDTSSEVATIYTGITNKTFELAGLYKNAYAQLPLFTNMLTSNNRILTSVGVDNYYTYMEKKFADSTNVVGEWDITTNGVGSKLYVWKNAQGSLLSSAVALNSNTRLAIRFLGYNGTNGLFQVRFDGTNFVNLWFSQTNEKGKYVCVWRGDNITARKIRAISVQNR